MKTITATSVICLLVLMVPMTASAIQTEECAKVEIEPNDFQIQEGETFTINIIVSPITTIDSFAADDIRWDPTMASLVKNPERGNLFENGLIWINGKEINNEKGQILYTAWGSNKETETAGIFATLTFQAKKDGKFQLYLDPEDTLAAADGEVYMTTITGNGQEREEFTSTETIMQNEPDNESQLWMLAGGLFFSIILGTWITYITYKKNKYNKDEKCAKKSAEKNIKKNKSITIKVERHGQ